MQPSNRLTDLQERHPEATRLTDLQIFGRPVIARRATCVVCARYELQSHRPGLCVHCAADVPATRAFVVDRVLLFERRVDYTADVLNDAVDVADDALRLRYERYEYARDEWLRASLASEMPDDFDPKTAERVQAIEAMARTGKRDPLLDLVRLWLAHSDALDQRIALDPWIAACEAVLL